MLSTTKDYICESAIEYKICQQKTTKTTINVSPKQTEKKQTPRHAAIQTEP